MEAEMVRWYRASMVVIGTWLVLSGGPACHDPHERPETPSEPGAERDEFHTQSVGRLWGGRILDGSESPNGRRVALRTKVRHGQSIWLDGQYGPVYDEIKEVAWSPGSRRVAYCAKKNDLWRLVVNGKESSAKYFFMTDITFSPNGKRHGFIAVSREEEGSLVVLDGKEHPHIFEEIGRPGIVWSPDGRRVAFAANTGSGYSVFLDGEMGPVFDSVFEFTFSPDGRRWAYMAKKGEQWFVVIQGQKTRAYDWLGRDGPKFSPDSRHIAYIARDGNDWIVVEDGREVARHPVAKELTYSPDGRLGYYAQNKNGQWLVSLGGKIVGNHESLGQTGIVFSPTGEHYAYAASDGTDWFVVHDGRQGPGFPKLGGQTLTFNSSGNQLAYVVIEDAHMFVVLNGQEGPRFDQIVGELTFSRSGRELAYSVIDKRQWAVVVNDKRGPNYRGILSGPVCVEGGMEYLALQGAEVLRVRESLD